MVQTAGFDPSAIPVGPSEGRRQPDREPDSARITPVNQLEDLQASRRRADAEEPIVDPPTRVAFTAKFGPDTDGFPLQIVRGADLVGAENFDFEIITARRISRADREVLLRAQEEQSAAVETEQQQAVVETDRADAAAGQTEERVQDDSETRESETRDSEERSETRLDLEV